MQKGPPGIHIWMIFTDFWEAVLDNLSNFGENYEKWEIMPTYVQEHDFTGSTI